MSPLAIVTARIGSTRFPGKMLADLGGKPLVLWATDAAINAFGADNVVAAVPASSENDELAKLLGTTCEVFRWDGPEADVLGRVHACAHRHRWHPDAVIVRVTPDDPFKDAAALKAVSLGKRLPVELGGEAFTLAMLDEAESQHPWVGMTGDHREHISWAIFGTDNPAPKAPDGVWTVDTPEDLEKARERARTASARTLVEQGMPVGDVLAGWAG